jgi:L-rhamnose mutarotase
MNGNDHAELASALPEPPKLMRRVLTLDLRPGPAVQEAYRAHHAAVWPCVEESLRAIGIRALDIYALERRLVMVLETDQGFDMAERFAAHVASDPRCAEWEALMKTLQQAPPGAPPGVLWTEMERVYRLEPSAG